MGLQISANVTDRVIVSIQTMVSTVPFLLFKIISYYSFLLAALVLFALTSCKSSRNLDVEYHLHGQR